MLRLPSAVARFDIVVPRLGEGCLRVNFAATN
jgi:hypothetical protein